MLLLSSDQTSSTAGVCSDCGQSAVRRTSFHDERSHADLHLCVRCLVWLYHRRQFESGCCG